MMELVQLDRHPADFAQRKTRVIVVSVEGSDDAQKTQKDFPNLLVLSDKDHGLSNAAQLIHAHANPNGDDADTPTTILVDKHGIVRWLARPGQVISRLSPDEVLQAIDQYAR